MAGATSPWEKNSVTSPVSQYAEPMPWLAALVCNSAFDLALHDAYGRLVELPVYKTYGPAFLERDLERFLEPAKGSTVSFSERFPADYLVKEVPQRLLAWHLVGGLDPLSPEELTGAEPQDGYPILLEDWIQSDGLKCLKVKLRGIDDAWDYQRLLKVAQIALSLGVEWLSADFNCTVQEPAYVNRILDDLRNNHPQVYNRIRYVEQPFPYDLEEHRIDVHTVSARKPLFLDESAHDWRMIRLGHELGWTGVALKTCKTQTGAILSACWARAHGMELMVQDLTNPMLAQIPHLLLAAHVGTIMGVETNSMQFYPKPLPQRPRSIRECINGDKAWLTFLRCAVRVSATGLRKSSVNCRTLRWCCELSSLTTLDALTRFHFNRSRARFERCGVNKTSSRSVRRKPV